MKQANSAPVRLFAKGLPIARAVGARLISPAFQRGVSAPIIHPESRRDAAKADETASAYGINRLQSVRILVSFRAKLFADYFSTLPHNNLQEQTYSPRQGRHELPRTRDFRAAEANPLILSPISLMATFMQREFSLQSSHAACQPKAASRGQFIA